MSDSQPPPVSQSEMRKASPGNSPPSPDATEPESKLSRKREREVSVEPATTPKANMETDPLLRETRTPAKKNRRHLDPTEEEESNSDSPPLSVSPPQEMKMKVRQISQGVEDLSWRNMTAINPDKEMEREADLELEQEPEAAPENGHQDTSTDSVQDSTQPQLQEGHSPPKSPDGSQYSQPMTDIQATDVTDVDGSSTKGLTRTRSDSEAGDKGLKRKFLERGTSHGPPENGDAAQHHAEPLKRPRDDSDHDDNPRETKRPSPPPEPKSPPRKMPASPKIPKMGGFMAYASSSSPFASVKGQNIFASAKPTPSPSPFSISALSGNVTSANTSDTPKMGESSSTPLSTKRTGFEAFSSSSSPFAAAARSKSPILGSTSKLNRNRSPPRRTNSASSNPFALYASGLQSFSVPVPKRARAGSPEDNSSRSSLERTTAVSVLDPSSAADSEAEDEGDDRPSSFGERLRASKDDEEGSKSDDEQPKIVLTELDVMTGEEDEETLTQVRGKLFSLSGGNQWKERGTGLLKLNVKRDDGTGARLVMRKEAVYTLLLNVTLFPGMRCVLNPQDARYLRFSVIEDGATTHYNLRVSNAKIAQELLEEINANIPVA